jgi:predicted MPP superfamily phosphohydrolase
MTQKSIIVEESTTFSTKKSHLVQSNIYYITKLFQNNVPHSSISEDALKSYYIDFYLSHIQHNGFINFVTNLEANSKTIYYILEGLKSIKALKHLQLLTNAINIKKDKLNLLFLFDNIFLKFQQEENLLALNEQWLKEHPNLLILKTDKVQEKLKKQIEQNQEEKPYTRVIKQLCSMIDEEFLRITAGDNNNIYNRSWYFKTTQGHYYMIQKKKEVSLYNSFTKEKILTTHMNRNMRDNPQSFFSSLWSRKT